jgi:hypothetical protein
VRQASAVAITVLHERADNMDDWVPMTYGSCPYSATIIGRKPTVVRFNKPFRRVHASSDGALTRGPTVAGALFELGDRENRLYSPPGTSF